MIAGCKAKNGRGRAYQGMPWQEDVTIPCRRDKWRGYKEPHQLLIKSPTIHIPGCPVQTSLYRAGAL